MKGTFEAVGVVCQKIKFTKKLSRKMQKSRRSIEFKQTYVNICLLWQIVVLPSRVKRRALHLVFSSFPPHFFFTELCLGDERRTRENFDYPLQPTSPVFPSERGFPPVSSSAVCRFSLHFPKCAPLGCN